MKYVLFLLCLTVQTTLFSVETAPVSYPDPGFSQTFVMIGIALVFFYVILWRPESKRRKMIESKRSSIKKGDRVTVFGFFGTVVQIKEQTVIISLFDGAKMEVLKQAISDVESSDKSDKSEA